MYSSFQLVVTSNIQYVKKSNVCVPGKMSSFIKSIQFLITVIDINLLLHYDIILLYGHMLLYCSMTSSGK